MNRPKIKCPTCGKMLRSAEMIEHYRDNLKCDAKAGWKVLEELFLGAVDKMLGSPIEGDG